MKGDVHKSHLFILYSKTGLFIVFVNIITHIIMGDKMKRTIAFFLLPVTFFIVISCNDQEPEFLNIAEPNLANTIEEDIVFIKSKTGDGPWVERQVIPVYWDGVSTLDYGVYYKFHNESDKLAAYSTIPGLLEEYLQFKETEVKSKVKGSPSLSTVFGTAHMEVSPNGRGTILKFDSETWNSHFAADDTVYHKFFNPDFYQELYDDGQEHYLLLAVQEPCPLQANGWASVWFFAYKLAEDSDFGECL